jgi:hypothetical protein
LEVEEEYLLAQEVKQKDQSLGEVAVREKDDHGLWSCDERPGGQLEHEVVVVVVVAPDGRGKMVA